MNVKRATPAPDPKRLLAWYDQHARELPWRQPPGARSDPYAVWLSEIMLQQTTVAAVKPYFLTFLKRWPSVRDLAAATIDDVMRAWSGLGYYSRARNLHACARLVAARPDAAFPDVEAELRQLPGVGPYTAAAIAAIAFGRRAVVVDGNVERVIARLHAIDAPLPGAKKDIRQHADLLTPNERAGDFAQAMMDLGATICTPKSPLCGECPLSRSCIARSRGAPEAFPVKAPKKARPVRHGSVFYAQRSDGAVLVRTRPPSGLLGGMTELPGGEWSEDASRALAALKPIEADWRRAPGHIEHVFTHFSLRLTVFVARVDMKADLPADHRWSQQLDAEALPTLMRKVIRRARSL